MNNFIYYIVDYLKEIEVGYPVHIGVFDDKESIVVKPISGSEVIHEYMNGMMDVRLPFEMSIKSKNQEEAFNVLTKVMTHMRHIKSFLDKEHQDHGLLNVVIDQIPFFEGKKKDGYFYYHATMRVDLTVQ